MKNINYFFLLFFLFVCSACNKKSNTGIDSFDTVERIVDYDSIYSDKTSPFGAIYDLAISDHILITGHVNDEYNFSFIDLDKKKVLCRWGRRGEAADEFIDFGPDLAILDSQLVFLSCMKKEVNYVSIPDILGNKKDVAIRKESYPYTVDFRPNRLSIVNDKEIFLGYFKEGRLGVLDSMDENVNCFFEYPFDCGEVTGIYRGTVFQGEMKSNSKRGKFVISTFSSDVFEIYQVLDTTIQRVYVSPFKHAPKIWKKGDRFTTDDDRNIAGLMNMAVSDDFICFTYSAQSYDEALNSEKASNEILCFDWDGNKIKKYLLPFPINTFCIDNQFIYGIRYYNDETIIYRFKL